MMQSFDFKNPNWVEKASQIHQGILLEIEHYLQQLLDRLWLKKQACKKALKTIKGLEAPNDPKLAYLKKQALLWELLRELKLESLVEEKIKTSFGEDCFFLVQHSRKMH